MWGWKARGTGNNRVWFLGGVNNGSMLYAIYSDIKKDGQW